MAAFLEPVREGVFILRAGPQAFTYGDPYIASGTVLTLHPTSCEVCGFTSRAEDRASALKLFEDVRACLLAAGFKTIHWDRRRASGIVHNVRITNG